jgi:cystathionine gamma-synthase
VAVHSVTKFIGGHSDLLGGVVTVGDSNLLAALRQARELAGVTPALETFLAVRGARTLALRLEQAQHSAITLAERLARHPHVTLTRYPGLASHPTHDAARRQMLLPGNGGPWFDRGLDRAQAGGVLNELQPGAHGVCGGAAATHVERDDRAEALELMCT